jgi:hypothetical protein
VQRPQFAYHTPDECQDESFVYYFDGHTVSALTKITTLAVGGEIRGIPLPTQTDGTFCWRAVRVANVPANFQLGIQFIDPFGNELSDTYIPVDLSEHPSALPEFFFLVPNEPEIVCPPGSVILVNLKRLG